MLIKFWQIFLTISLVPLPIILLSLVLNVFGVNILDNLIVFNIKVRDMTNLLKF